MTQVALEFAELRPDPKQILTIEEAAAEAAACIRGASAARSRAACCTRIPHCASGATDVPDPAPRSLALAGRRQRRADRPKLMPRASAKPTIEPRPYCRRDGTMTDGWSVRWRDHEGRRWRKTFGALEEADLFRAQLALNGDRTEAGGGRGDDPLRVLAGLAGRCPYTAGRAHASRLRKPVAATRRAVLRRVADGRIRPRQLCQWKTQLLADGVGPELESALGSATGWPPVDADAAW